MDFLGSGVDEDLKGVDLAEVDVAGVGLYMLIWFSMAVLLTLFTVIIGGGVGSFEVGLVEDNPNCVLATDEDFSGTVNGYFSYIGSDDCVKIPHVIDKQ